MAKVKQKKGIKNKIISPFKNYWEKSNYIIFGAGILVLVLGFFLMTNDPWDNPLSLTVAPLVLLLAYLVIFPLAILYKKDTKQNNE
ncbi:MAG: hypothetical protein CR986_08960 [Ignavibacteriae bacterium]|nr:MAG: hypothetical protein CR986_08960 [Ignavibacteriota bacterium]